MHAKNQRHDRDKLIEEHQNYVRNIALRLVRTLNLPNSQLDEYISAGYLGLVEAAERFKPSPGRPFKPFAFLRIRGAIIDSIRSSSHVSAAAYKLSKALQAAHELREELDIISQDKVLSQRAPVRSEEATAKLAKILDYAAQGVLVFRLSLTEVTGEINGIPDPEESVDKKIESKQDQKNILQLVETLPEKERTIIEEHYFNGKSFIEIAEEYEGMSKSWVSRLHARAVRMLKENYMAIIEGNKKLSDVTNPSVAHACGM